MIISLYVLDTNLLSEIKRTELVAKSVLCMDALFSTKKAFKVQWDIMVLRSREREGKGVNGVYYYSG